MTKRVNELDVNVTRVELSDTVSAGIRWNAFDNGMVPFFEEHTIRLENHYSVEAWYALPAMERAICIARKRIDIAIQNLQSEAEIKRAKQQAKKK